MQCHLCSITQYTLNEGIKQHHEQSVCEKCGPHVVKLWIRNTCIQYLIWPILSVLGVLTLFILLNFIVDV